MNNYKELKVWQKSVELAVKIYKETKEFPSTEVYGLTSQIRRAACSVPSNIAEGAGRSSNREFQHFLSISLGSAFEMETQLIIAQQLNFIPEEEFSSFTIEISEIEKMLRGLQKSLS